MTTRRKPQEAVIGSYTPIPHAVLDCTAFRGASDRAKSMLFEVLRQHNGKNNGHLQLAVSWLKPRGWKSADQIQKAKGELLERGLIIKTKLGGLGIGPDRFALTWLHISDYVGLDIKQGAYHPGKWQLMDPLPPLKNQNAHSASRNEKNRDDRSASRDGAAPLHGAADVPTAPPHGTKTTISGSSPIPPHGNNECCQLPPAKTRLRAVGRKGRSGVKGGGRPTI